MRKLIAIVSLGVLGPITASWAQLNAPNEAGVTLSELHMVVKDVEAEKKVWISMSGKPLKIDGVDVIKFHGVLVFVEQGIPSGSNAGAALDHPGFLVQDSTEWLNKVEAAGVKVIRNDPARPNHGYVYTSEDMRIEIKVRPHGIKDLRALFHEAGQNLVRASDAGRTPSLPRWRPGRRNA